MPSQSEQQKQQQQLASPLQPQPQHPFLDAWLQLHAGDVLNEEEDAEVLDERRRGEYEGLPPAAAEATNDVLLPDAAPSDFDMGPLYDSGGPRHRCPEGRRASGSPRPSTS